VFVCKDFRLGRISQADYVEAVAAIDAEWSTLGRSPPQARQPIVWATTVNGVSSQYGDTSWAARQVLGPPNVFPNHGDIPQAWASAAPDGGTEWIEVGFAPPSSIAAVVVYETFNPGALAGVTLLTEDGASVAVSTDREVAETSPEGSVHRRFELACTPRRVRAVRLDLDSLRVPGWNEIDAIGIMPCTP
jgi:OmpA-OmpF porin, OOP family